jgi:hypothetical protein
MDQQLARALKRSIEEQPWYTRWTIKGAPWANGIDLDSPDIKPKAGCLALVIVAAVLSLLVAIPKTR